MQRPTSVCVQSPSQTPAHVAVRCVDSALCAKPCTMVTSSVPVAGVPTCTQVSDHAMAISLPYT